MSLKTRAILVLVIGVVMGVSLSLSGNMLAVKPAPQEADLAWEQARLLAEVMERVKHDYVEPLDDAELLESAIRGMVSTRIPNIWTPTNIATFASAQPVAIRVLALKSGKSMAPSR